VGRDGATMVIKALRSVGQPGMANTSIWRGVMARLNGLLKSTAKYFWLVMQQSQVHLDNGLGYPREGCKHICFVIQHHTKHLRNEMQASR